MTPELAASGRNVVVRTEGGPGSQLSILTHLPSPGSEGEILGVTGGGSYGGTTTGRVVVVALAVVVVVARG